jgi:FR47-like protein
MVAESPVALDPDASSVGNAVDLKASDGDDTVALADIAKPGPFGPHSVQLGRYVGVRRDASLVAVACERFLLDGFVELCTICTRSDARRRSYASALTRLLAQRARTSGYVPFLHAFPTISTRSHFIGDWAFVPDGICSYFGTDLARHRRELAARSRARLQLACRNRQRFYGCASSAQFSVDASNN